MTDLRKAAKMALEALEEIHVGNMTPMAEENWNEALIALRQALAQLDSTSDSAESFCKQELHNLMSVAGRMALELECLLLDTKDLSVVSKWWDTGMESLQAYRDYIWSITHGKEEIIALAQPEQEPVWTIEECDRTAKTLRYIQGIAEQGEGRAMHEDESLEQFLLLYVQKLEKQQDIKTQTVRVLTEQCATLIQERDDLQKEVWSNKGQALAQPEQTPTLTEKDGSPCPEFWDWLPKAYNFEGLGEFTKYNMEVAFLAGKNTALAQPEQKFSTKDCPQPELCHGKKCEYCRDMEKAEQEPVAWIGNADFVKGQFVEGRVRRVWWECNTGVGQPLYTEPPRKKWVGLTEGELIDIQNCNRGFWTNAAKIEQLLKDKNT